MVLYNRLYRAVHMRTHLSQDGPQVQIVRLRHYPVRVARERPARDGPHQRFALAHTAHQVRHQVRQVRHHTTHTTIGYGTQSQDTAFLKPQCFIQFRFLKEG